MKISELGLYIPFISLQDPALPERFVLVSVPTPNTCHSLEINRYT